METPSQIDKNLSQPAHWSSAPNNTASKDSAGQAVMDYCQRVADGLTAAGDCPCCASTVHVTFFIEGIQVKCSTGCFCFEFRRNQQGDFVSGQLNFPGNKAEGSLQTLAW